MEFLPEEIDGYAHEYTTPESDPLAALNRETNMKVLMPRMLSGHLQGRILSMFSHMIQPERILEVGTYTGYAAMCMAEGLKEGGMLTTIDINPEIETIARKHFEAGNLADKIEFRIGNALNIIPELEGPFQMVFIDADKENYLNYYQQVIDKVSTGGFIIADNVLWSGKVTGDYEAMDEETRALVDYVKFVHDDERVENVLMPVRDGLMVARKS